jgi:dinuclear metal center YbgI/SA1388 family protein
MAVPNVPIAGLSPIVLAEYLNSLLPNSLKDYCPNGLQIEGTRAIRRVITGVTATEELLEAAQQVKADALLVHHGLFWNGDSPCLVGWRRRRLEAFLASGMTLLAYHLPLDVHPEYGNNRRLAEHLEIEILDVRAEQGLLWFGRLARAMTEDDLSHHLRRKLSHEPLIVMPRVPSFQSEGKARIQNIAWCTGGAQRYFESALEAAPFRLDAYITGEISEQCVHLAKASGVSFICAGHHATERYGVQALGQHLVERFGLEHEFVECESPV